MELTINLPMDVDRVAALGTAERHLKLIREALGISVVSRAGALRLAGEDESVNRAATLIGELADAARRRTPLQREDVLDRLHELAGRGRGGGDGREPPLKIYGQGKAIEPMTAGQRRYLQAIRGHDLVFCTGPAGTGKTYLAVAAAVAMLRAEKARRLVLVRPAVEAGEKLGFLPGDMQQKVNPYLRPLLDALHDMMPFEQAQRFMHTDVIEIVPLAFMRGRTLNHAAIICDEAQNTTTGQMLMLLTRLGHGSKMVVTGDTSQIDLESGVESGLIDAIRRLRHVSGVARVTLERADIVRHSLVQQIVDAYGREPGNG